MKNYKAYAIEAQHQGLTVELYLKTVLHYSGRKIQKLTRQKGVLLNKKNVFLQKKLKNGDMLRVLLLEDQSYGVTPEQGEVDILFEDEQMIIINKPPGILVHPAGQTMSHTLANYLAWYYRQKNELCTIRPLHRLDRDTSGCILFAKNAHTQTLLEQQLASGLFKRTYHALVEGSIEPKAGTIDAPIGSHPTKPNRRAVNCQGEQAVTHYTTLKTMGSMSLLELNLETGKTHQIRVHLAHIGHPIIGDRMYGRSSPLISRQALHAVSIKFMHPQDNKEIEVRAPYPEDISRLVMDKHE